MVRLVHRGVATARLAAVEAGPPVPVEAWRYGRGTLCAPGRRQRARSVRRAATAAPSTAVTVTGVALSGGDSGNYTVSQPAGLTASISAKSAYHRRPVDVSPRMYFPRSAWTALPR